MQCGSAKENAVDSAEKLFLFHLEGVVPTPFIESGNLAKGRLLVRADDIGFW